jgi:hypothetical protein
VLSHLRWTFVWQRPQQLVSRLAAGFERTWFVEEPEPVEGLMDDLAAFKSPAGLVLRQRQALREAAVVFTGGRSLHRSVVERRATDVHCFPSGVEPEHYATAVTLRNGKRGDGRPVAGYVGVIDERIDLDIVGGLATARADWEIMMVGPVLKVDPADLPQAPNITYTGPRRYAELPEVMAGFDVALMPFALNDATRSISPTKTLEYLAAGAERARPILAAQHWDTIAGAMSCLVAAQRQAATRESA